MSARAISSLLSLMRSRKMVGLFFFLICFQTTMKILFLDVDGVLNCVSTEDRIDTIFGEFIGLDPKLVARLIDWLRSRDVAVVLSSTWRLDDRFDNAFTKALTAAGIKWISTTPNLGHRGRDIHQWLTDNTDRLGITHWAILDDISDVSPVGRGLVQTSDRHGLQDKHLQKLDQLLGF